MNSALLAKQMWRMLTQPNLLMTKVFKARYFPHSSAVDVGWGINPSVAWRGIKEAANIFREDFVWNEELGKWIWNHNATGEFSVKSAYLTICGKMRKRRVEQEGQTSAIVKDNFWPSLWKLQIPSRIKLFIWRCFYNGVPTFSNLRRRGCLVNNVCVFCGWENENILHLLRDCWWGKFIRQELKIRICIENIRCEDPGQWLWSCSRICNEEEFRKLCVVSWQIWKCRNAGIHEGKESNLPMVKEYILHMLDTYKTGEGIQPLWLGAGEGRNATYGVFCDGSFDPVSTEAGCGVVLKFGDSCLCSRALFIKSLESVFCSEGTALLEGMKLASALSLELVTFFSDSMEVLKALSIGYWGPELGISWLKECGSLMARYRGWRVAYIPRVQNSEADLLARLARVRNESWTWTVQEVVAS